MLPVLLSVSHTLLYSLGGVISTGLIFNKYLLITKKIEKMPRMRSQVLPSALKNVCSSGTEHGREPSPCSPRVFDCQTCQTRLDGIMDLKKSHWEGPWLPAHVKHSHSCSGQTSVSVSIAWGEFGACRFPGQAWDYLGGSDSIDLMGPGNLHIL